MVYVEYIFIIFNRSVVSVACEIIQMHFDVICNYREVFNMGVWGIDILLGVVYKWTTYILVCWVYVYQYFSSLYN